jgi:hypothetical protein
MGRASALPAPSDRSAPGELLVLPELVVPELVGPELVVPELVGPELVVPELVVPQRVGSRAAAFS